MTAENAIKANEIGKIRHRSNTWPAGRKVKSYRKVLLASTVAGVISYPVIAFMVYRFEVFTDILFVLTTPFLLSILIAYIVYRWNVYINLVILVGTKGIASLRFVGNENRLVKKQVIRFNEKLSLLSKVIDHSTNYSYNYTTCDLRWVDERNRTAEKISFGFNRYNDPEGEADLFTVMETWTAFKEKAVKKHIEKNGSYTFKADNGIIEIKVSKDELNFDDSYSIRPFTFKDIRSFYVEDGMLNIKAQKNNPNLRSKNIDTGIKWKIKCCKITDVDLLLKVMERAKKGKKLLP